MRLGAGWKVGNHLVLPGLVSPVGELEEPGVCLVDGHLEGLGHPAHPDLQGGLALGGQG